MCKNGFRHSILNTELDQRLFEHLPNEIEEDKEDDEEFAELASKEIFILASISFIVYFPVYYFFYCVSYNEKIREL